MLDKQEITFREARWPYRIQFLHRSDNKEYYGLYREIIASQHAINQAVIKLQQLVNTEKVYVEENAVADMDEFSVKVARVNAVVPVLRLNGIKVEHATSEVREQYNIIDSALSRIQRVLGINDSFLGMAFASDSGRKVKLQQNATIMSLRYVTSRIEAFYRSLGEDTAKLIKQYYTANQILCRRLVSVVETKSSQVNSTRLVNRLCSLFSCPWLTRTPTSRWKTKQAT